MKTWRKLALVGFLASVSAAGCVVGSGDDDDDSNTVGGAGGTTAGTGGKGGTGGSSAGTGGSSAGTGGSTGATGGSGGSSGTGGSGGGGIQCDPTGSLGGTLGSCTPTDTTNACQVCIQAQCCEAWNRCTATSPDNPCGFGGPAGSTNGEIGCYQDCVINAQLDGGVANSETMGACAGGCATSGCGTIADTTNVLVECMNNDCFADCLEVQ